jgi:hypothetical protein
MLVTAIRLTTDATLLADDSPDRESAGSEGAVTDAGVWPPDRH